MPCCSLPLLSLSSSRVPGPFRGLPCPHASPACLNLLLLGVVPGGSLNAEQLLALVDLTRCCPLALQHRTEGMAEKLETDS